MAAMRVTLGVLAAFALAAGCGGRQMLDLPAVDGGAGSPGRNGAAGSVGTGSAGSVGTGNAGTFGILGAAASSGSVGAAGTIGTTGTGAAGFTGSAYMVEPVDLTIATPTFSMSCENGATITFVDPCLVGVSLGSAGDPSAQGIHEVECTAVAANGGSVGFSFLATLPPTQNPQNFFSLTPTGLGVALPDGQQARASAISGSLNYYVVDPKNQAFEARFTGLVTWTEPSGATFQCKMDSMIWGAPGGFN
jgi:hypothetical protein